MSRTHTQEQLDLEVATRLFHYRWAQWNQQVVGSSPLYTPGRFLAAPDDFLSHLYQDAPTTTPRHEHALAKVPEYSSDETCAFRAAEQADLFSSGGARLSRESNQWVVELGGRLFTSPRLPEVLCRASLAWVGTAPTVGK